MDREYVDFMADHPVLSRDEEIRLSKLKDQGDKGARDKLIRSNIRLVLTQVKRYVGKGLPEDDLIQEGIIGMIKGVDRYEWERGYKLSTYSVWWIRQSLGRALAEQGRIIRLPVHMLEKVNKILACQDFLKKQGAGTEKDIDRIAIEIGMDPKEARKIWEYNQSTWVESLDKAHGDGDDDAARLDQFIADTGPAISEIVEAVDCRQIIASILADLTAREARIIEMRYGLNGYGGVPATLEKIGSHLSLTKERVRQIESEALEKIKKYKILEDIC